MVSSVDKLMNVPYGTKQWATLYKNVRSEMKDKYKGQFVLTIPGHVIEPELELHLNEISRWVDVEDVFNKHTAFNSPFRFTPREDAEYNFDHKQINVFAMIQQSNGEVIILKKNNGEIHFPGGHVDYCLDAYRLTPEQLLRKAMLDELNEELSIFSDNNKKVVFEDVLPEKPELIINSRRGWNDLFHVAVIYKINLGDVKFTFKSEEEKKHSVIKCDPYDLEFNNIKNVNVWVKMTQKFLKVND